MPYQLIVKLSTSEQPVVLDINHSTELYSDVMRSFEGMPSSRDHGKLLTVPTLSGHVHFKRSDISYVEWKVVEPTTDPKYPFHLKIVFAGRESPYVLRFLTKAARDSAMKDLCEGVERAKPTVITFLKDDNISVGVDCHKILYFNTDGT